MLLDYGNALWELYDFWVLFLELEELISFWIIFL